MEESSVRSNHETRFITFPAMNSKEFKCPVCDKYFSRKFTLDAHMLIHRGEKPHTCQFCGKSFRQKGTLMRHKALHSTKYLFHCTLCNHGFRQKNVFIFHLKHRHNVSTETLDRRKYRTEPKDYQSIVDTLPPFVQMDSAAIASTGDHFDAILCESIQKPDKGSSEVSEYDFAVSNHVQDVHNSSTSSNAESISYENPGVYGSSKAQIFTSKYKETHKGSFEDVKPCTSSNFNDVRISEVSSRNCGMLLSNTVNPVFSHMTNVTSSDDINDDTITCIPCQLSFTSEVEFKYHMKTHVQSVLLADASTDGTQELSNISSIQCEGSSDSFPAANLFIEEKSMSDVVAIPDSQSMCDQTKLPVKAEILDPEIDSSSFQITNDGEIPGNSSLLYENKSPCNQHKLECPVCKVSLDGDSAFKKHSNSHDSYSLLKLISESLGNKSAACSHQNNFSSTRRTSAEDHSSTLPINNNKKLRQNFRNTDAYCKKILVQTKSSSTRSKSAFKMFVCVQCDKKFPNKFLLEYHRQLHLSTKGFFCKCCRESFSSKKSLLSHTRLHHMKTFTCSKCSQNFNYRRLFDSHQKQCSKGVNTKTSNGSSINFPVVNIESLLNSDMSGVVGVIPVCTESGEENNLKLGIPVMSVSQIKALYMT